MFLYDAEDWPEYAKKYTCMDRAKLAKYRFSLGSNVNADISVEQQLQETYRMKTMKGHFEFSRGLDYNEGEVWYVVIADCSLEQIYHEMPLIRYEVTLTNGDSQLPAEEYGLATIHTALVVVLVAAGLYGFTLVQSHRNTLGSMHLIVKLLVVAYIFNLISTSTESIHLWMYANDGSGSHILNTTAELTQVIFSCIVNFVLLALACGWTLTDSDTGMSFMVALRNPSKLFQFVEIGGIKLPAIVGTPASLVVVLFTFSFVLVEAFDVMTTNQDDDFSKFHAHDGIAGTVMMIMQLLFNALFLYSISLTRKVVPPRLKDFLTRLAVSGTLWFITTPCMVFTAPLFRKVLRHRLITGGTILLQSTAILVMCTLFLTSSTEYYKLSTMANAGTMMGLATGEVARPTGKAID
eukprot:m.48627 g.48627  ORF g.48627 m.48627 type:complete len:408 (-) comp10575_c0_seq2:1312-2535(-)